MEMLQTQEFAVGLAVGFVIAMALYMSLQGKPKINTMIELEKKKVVHAKTIKDIEDAGGDLIAMCRCWKSTKVRAVSPLHAICRGESHFLLPSQFPLCDGSHVKLNEAGDNVGPLLLKKM
jgi:CDGSH-type Zn-finger protein